MEENNGWFEVDRLRKAIRETFPDIKGDGVDLPGLMQTEVERLRQENREWEICFDELEKVYLEEIAKLKKKLASVGISSV